MSSLSRTIRRGMARHAGRSALATRKMICPKCGKKLKRKWLSLRKVQCAGCGFQGRVK